MMTMGLLSHLEGECFDHGRADGEQGHDVASEAVRETIGYLVGATGTDTVGFVSTRLASVTGLMSSLLA